MNIHVDSQIDVKLKDNEPFTQSQIDAIVKEHERLRKILNDDLIDFAKNYANTDTDDAFERGRII